MPIPSRDAWRQVQDLIRASKRMTPSSRNASQSTRVPQQSWRIVETAGDHAKAATQDCFVMTGTKGSETYNGDKIECYNRMTDLLDGTRCIAAWFGGAWELIQAECEPTGDTTSSGEA